MVHSRSGTLELRQRQFEYRLVGPRDAFEPIEVVQVVAEGVLAVVRQRYLADEGR